MKPWVDLFGVDPFWLRLPSALAVGFAAAGIVVLGTMLDRTRTGLIAAVRARAASAGVLGGRRGEVLRSADRGRRVADGAAPDAVRPGRLVALDAVRASRLPPRTGCSSTWRCSGSRSSDAGDRAGWRRSCCPRSSRSRRAALATLPIVAARVRPAGADLLAAGAGRRRHRRRRADQWFMGSTVFSIVGVGAGRLRGRRDRAPAIAKTLGVAGARPSRPVAAAADRRAGRRIARSARSLSTSTGTS